MKGQANTEAGLHILTAMKAVATAYDGSRLSKLYAEDVEDAGIVSALDPIFAAYAAERGVSGSLSIPLPFQSGMVGALTGA